MESFINGLKIDFSTRPPKATLKAVLSKSNLVEFETQLLIISMGLTSLLSQ